MFTSSGDAYKNVAPLLLSRAFLGVGSVVGSRQLQRNSGEFSSWRDIYSRGQGYGTRKLFQETSDSGGRHGCFNSRR